MGQFCRTCFNSGSSINNQNYAVMENNIPNPTAAQSIKSLQTNAENTKRIISKKGLLESKVNAFNFLPKKLKSMMTNEEVKIQRNFK